METLTLLKLKLKLELNNENIRQTSAKRMIKTLLSIPGLVYSLSFLFLCFGLV